MTHYFALDPEMTDADWEAARKLAQARQRESGVRPAFFYDDGGISPVGYRRKDEMSGIPTHLGDPFAVVCHPYCSEVEVVYEDMRFAPITAAYARTFAAALLAAADRAEQPTTTEL